MIHLTIWIKFSILSGFPRLLLRTDKWFNQYWVIICINIININPTSPYKLQMCQWRCCRTCFSTLTLYNFKSFMSCPSFEVGYLVKPTYIETHKLAGIYRACTHFLLYSIPLLYIHMTMLDCWINNFPLSLCNLKRLAGPPWPTPIALMNKFKMVIEIGLQTEVVLDVQCCISMTSWWETSKW